MKNNTILYPALLAGLIACDPQASKQATIETAYLGTWQPLDNQYSPAITISRTENGTILAKSEGNKYYGPFTDVLQYTEKCQCLTNTNWLNQGIPLENKTITLHNRKFTKVE